MVKKLGFSVFIAIILALTACGNTSGYKDVSIEEAKELIDSGEVKVLDVRTPEEYGQGHIPNSTLIPLQELGQRLEELDKEETYLVVCRSGNRSAQASELLIQEGFTNIHNMTGGMSDWSYEVVN